jgi:hypothetical protein
MNWLNDTSIPIESWQVEDYRKLPLPSLFERLKDLDIHLDRSGFIAYADECDSPEDLAEQLVGDWELKAEREDRIYLIIFELWRRLMSEKPSLSIICNELDLQIYLYDKGQLEHPNGLIDALSSFLVLLEDNVDQGISAKEALELISPYFANDIETFLYDFISEQIDEDNDHYAQDLLDDFSIYLEGNKWFKLLHARLAMQNNHKVAEKIFSQIIEENLGEGDLQYNLELLSVMAELGDFDMFKQVLQQTAALLKTEEDFHDLLSICADFAQFHDKDHDATILHQILTIRSSRPLDQPFNPSDPDLPILLKFI